MQEVAGFTRIDKEDLATEKASNQAKDDYLTAHLAQMQQVFMVRKHNTNHPFCLLTYMY
jgi:hypothetical protein